MEKQKNIAIIPARSGSKGLKDKNIKNLAGKPLMAYTIEAALQSGIFAEVYVSTDSEEYAGIAGEYGARVPFLRSKVASTDSASSWEVVREALSRYEEAGSVFDMITLLQPTTPLRTAEDIKGAYDLYLNKKAKAIVSVCEVDHSPLWSNTLPENLSMDNFIRKDVRGLSRQEIKTYYRVNGGIYMIDVGYFKNTEDIYSSATYAYIMERKHSIDIDDALDFRIAEALVMMEE